ncbi:MAG: hypothetical protein AAF598_13655, partial [Bacteroidota bacterium]
MSNAPSYKSVLVFPKLDMGFLAGLLILIIIHSNSLIITAILKNYWLFFIDHIMLPWTRLVVLAIELPMLFIGFNWLAGKAPLSNRLLKAMLAMSVLTLLISQVRASFEPGPFLCGMAMLDGTYELL